LLLLLLVDSHGNNNFWFEYFVGSWKFTTFFFSISWTREFFFWLVLFAVRSWVDQQPLERKKQLQLFLV
jgi:hypothetical protein